MSSLTSEMLEQGIKKINKEIKYYSKEPQKNVINKVGADDLNKILGTYGLKFKTGTSIATIVKKLKVHKARLDNHYDVGKYQGRLADLKTNEEKVEHKKKEAESI